MVNVRKEDEVRDKILSVKKVLKEARLADCERRFLGDELFQFAKLRGCFELHDETGSSQRHVLRREMDARVKKMADEISKELPSVDNPEGRIRDLQWALYATDRKLLEPEWSLIDDDHYLKWWEIKQIDDVLSRIKAW